MWMKFLIVMLRVYSVMCCDIRCSCRSSYVRCYVNPWTLEAIPSGIPSTITELNMDNQLLRNLSSLHCSQYPNLYYLYVRNNMLNYLDDTDFTGCSALLYVILTNNSISHVGSETFSPVTSLNYLILDGNMITDLRFLRNVSNGLDELFLINNSISEIQRGSFDGKTNLRHLYLAGNMITDLSFLHSVDGRLYLLDLSDNKIVEINDSSFVRLSNLEILLLHGNGIGHITSGAFRSQTRSDLYIDLNDNPVSCGTRTRPRFCLNFTLTEWMDTGYDVRRPREACFVTPKRQNLHSNKDSIEVQFYVYCESAGYLMLPL